MLSRFKANALFFATLILALATLSMFQTGCVGAPKSVEEFSTMDDAAFTRWTARVAAHADAASTIALRDDMRAREDLERLCAILDGGALVSHEDNWIGPFVPLLMLEIQAMLDERGGVAGARLFEVFAAVKSGVRAALDRPAQ